MPGKMPKKPMKMPTPAMSAASGNRMSKMNAMDMKAVKKAGYKMGGVVKKKCK